MRRYDVVLRIFAKWFAMVALVVSFIYKLFDFCVNLSHFRHLRVSRLIVVRGRSLECKHRIALILSRNIVKTSRSCIVCQSVIKRQRIYPVSGKVYRVIWVVKRSWTNSCHFLLWLNRFALTQQSCFLNETYSNRRRGYCFHTILHNLEARAYELTAMASHATDLICS